MKNRWLPVLVLSLLVFAANFWGYPIYILDEAKNAACAMEMHQRGDWVVPTFNDVLRTDKPPLHYFFMIISYSLFGVSPFSARLFSVIMGIMASLLIYFFTRKCINERSGFLAALVFSCSFQVAIQFHMAVPDPYLITFVTAALLFFYYAHVFGRSVLFYYSYVSLALAFLAKGPVAVILVGLPLFLFLLTRKEFNWTALKKIKLIQGIGLFLLIVLPWWIAVTVQTNGEWVKGFLFDHNISRFSATMEGHRGIPGIAVVSVLLALLPLSFFLPQSLLLSWKERKRFSLAHLSFMVCLVVVAFFSISRTFLPGYIGPCLPFAAILIGFYLDQWISRNQINYSHWISFSFGAALSLAIPIAGYFALKLELGNDEMASYSFLLFPLLIGAIISFSFLIRKQIEKSIYTTAYTYILSSVLLFYFILPALLSENPISKLSGYLKGSSEFAIYNSSNSAWIFNTEKALPVLENENDLKLFLDRHPDGVVFTKASHLGSLDSTCFSVYRKKDLFERSVTVVLKKKVSCLESYAKGVAGR
jgi:4-amino-4-deoxy-L-arabinose transferase-like glycosyltransferase